MKTGRPPLPRPTRAHVDALVARAARDAHMPTGDVIHSLCMDAVAARRSVWKQLVADGYTETAIAAVWGCCHTTVLDMLGRRRARAA